MKQIKVQQRFELKERYSFEALLVEATINIRKKDIISLNETLDINEYLNAKPGYNYLVYVQGNSMIDENIFDGDILVVERSQNASNEDIVIASIDGELTVKKLFIDNDKIYLLSANKQFYPIEILNYNDFRIQGIVKYVIKNI